MGAADLRGAVEVGDGARDTQHAVVAARGQVHALGRAQQQLAASGVGRGDLVEQLAVGLGVGAQGALPRAWKSARPEVAGARRRGRRPGARGSPGDGTLISIGESTGTSTCRSMRSNSGPEMRAW